MEGTIKSARRVLEIFEFFAQTHAAATVKELSQCLGYPQSSTSLLLKSLLTQGYLRYDPPTRAYYPTLRVMLLGSWVHDEIFGNGSLISLLEGLRREFGHSVLLGMRQGIYVRYIVTLCAETTGLPPYATGILRPVCRAAVGKILLAGLRNAEISLIARRANAQETSPPARSRFPNCLPISRPAASAAGRKAGDGWWRDATSSPWPCRRCRGRWTWPSAWAAPKMPSPASATKWWTACGR